MRSARFGGAFRSRVNLIEGFPGVALPRLHDGSLDFAVAVVVPELLAAEFDHAELYASRSLIVARKEHPLASATSLAELVDADWLMNPSPESSTQVLFNSFVAYGLPLPQRIVECPSFGLAHNLMTGCDLLASMPEQLLQGEWARDRLTVLPIRERLPPCRFRSSRAATARSRRPPRCCSIACAIPRVARGCDEPHGTSRTTDWRKSG
jgi:DNA-binding transcriptional LysR family regulator